MGAILGLGLTHSPLLAGRDDHMTRIFRRVLQDPDLPEAYRRPQGWPPPTQQEWGVSQDPLNAIKKITTQLGFSEDAFNQALTDQDLFNAIESMRDQALNEFGLDGTPTFYVNGKQLSGEKTLEDLGKEIDPIAA